MAGATNRALKAAGIPKATIKTLRVESGGRMSLRSAIQIASGRGLPIGKASQHEEAQRIQSLRSARAANRPAPSPAPGTAPQRLSAAANRATYSGVVKHPETGEKRRVIASSGAEYASRVATAKKALQANYERTPLAANDRARVGLMRDSVAAIRAAGAPPKGHAFSTGRGNQGTEIAAFPHKIAAQNAAFFAYRGDGEKKSYVVVHKGTGLATATLPSKGAAEQYMAGTAKSGARIMDRVVAGDRKALRAVGEYGARREAAAAPKPKAKAAPVAAPPVSRAPRFTPSEMTDRRAKLLRSLSNQAGNARAQALFARKNGRDENGKTPTEAARHYKHVASRFQKVRRALLKGADSANVENTIRRKDGPYIGNKILRGSRQ